MRQEDLNALEDDELTRDKFGAATPKDSIRESLDNKLDEGVRFYEYKVRFNFQKAFEKAGHSYQQTRNILRWAEAAMHEEEQSRYLKRLARRHATLVLQRKARAGPYFGGCNLKNPYTDLLQDKKALSSESQAIQLLLGRSFHRHELVLNNCGMQGTLDPNLASTLSIQLASYHTISISRNVIPVLLHPTLPGLSIYQWRTVRTLHLSFNGLESLPPAIDLLTSLTTLNVAYNKLSSLPSAFPHLTQLTHLNVSHNRLTSLPPWLGDLTHLKYLNLDTNHITELPPTFHKLTCLTYLDLCSNKLQHLAILPSPRTQLWHRRSCPLDWVLVHPEAEEQQHKQENPSQGLSVIERMSGKGMT